MDINVASDLRDIERKMGRKIPESLLRSVTDEKLKDRKLIMLEPSESSVLTGTQSLNCKIQLLKREMAQLRDIDVKLMRQLISINDGIESTRWALEERGVGLVSVSSREYLTGSPCSLSSRDASRSSSVSSLQQDCGDGFDSMSLGSYLDTLEDPTPYHPFNG